MLEALMNLTSALGLSTSAGLNAYIPLLTVAVLSRFTPLLTLEEPWTLLNNEWIMVLLLILLLIETFADKIPAIDSFNDILQTFVRPTAGAILFAATTQSSIHVHPLLAMGCGVILAGGVHAIKMGGRPVVTATTGGIGNPIVSVLEDVVSAITSLVAVIFPFLLLAWVFLMALFALLIVRWRRKRATA